MGNSKKSAVDITCPISPEHGETCREKGKLATDLRDNGQTNNYALGARASFEKHTSHSACQGCPLSAANRLASSAGKMQRQIPSSYRV